MSGYGLLFRGIHYAVQGTALGAAAGLTATDAAALEAPVPALLQPTASAESRIERALRVAAAPPRPGAGDEDGIARPIAGRSEAFIDPPDERQPADPEVLFFRQLSIPNVYSSEPSAVAVPIIARAVAPRLDAPLPPAPPASALHASALSAFDRWEGTPSPDAPRQAVLRAAGAPEMSAVGSEIRLLEFLGSRKSPRAIPEFALGLPDSFGPAGSSQSETEDNLPRYSPGNYDVTPIRVPALPWPYAPLSLAPHFFSSPGGTDAAAPTHGSSADQDDAVAGSGQAKEQDILELQALSRGGLAVSGGYSSIEGPVASIKLARTNIGAPGRDLTLSGRYSRVQALMEMGASDTNFAGTGFAVAPTLFYSRSKAVGFDKDINSGLFVQTARGINFYLGRPLKRGVRFAANYRFSDEDFLIRRKNALCDIGVHASFFCSALGRSSSSVLSLALSLDRRDSVVDPTRGFQLRISQDLAGLGGTTRFIRYRAGGTFYKRLSGNLDLSIGLEGGYAKGYDGRDVPLFDRFYIGGNSMRGFDLRGLGPKIVPSGATPGQATAIGGQAYYVGRVELTFRMTEEPRRFGAMPSLFVDAGSVFGARASALATGEALIGNSASPRVAVGIGMTFNLAPGKLRFSIAQPVKRQEGDRSKVFSISFGTAF